jgi:hypothetical protein
LRLIERQPAGGRDAQASHAQHAGASTHCADRLTHEAVLRHAGEQCGPDIEASLADAAKEGVKSGLKMNNRTGTVW